MGPRSEVGGEVDVEAGMSSPLLSVMAFSISLVAEADMPEGREAAAGGRTSSPGFFPDTLGDLAPTAPLRGEWIGEGAFFAALVSGLFRFLPLGAIDAAGVAAVLAVAADGFAAAVALAAAAAAV